MEENSAVESLNPVVRSSEKSTTFHFTLSSAGTARLELVGSKTKPEFLPWPNRRGRCQNHLRVRDRRSERPEELRETKDSYRSR